MKIVVYDRFAAGPEVIAALRQVAPGAEVVAPADDRLAEELADAEVFFGFCSAEAFRQARSLRWVQSSSAGMEHWLGSELKDRDVVMTNASGVHASQVAEMAWTLTLCLKRHLPLLLRQQQEHLWQWGPVYEELDGATAGIVGLGGIGRRYARVAAAFGMCVVAVDARPADKPNYVDALWGAERLPELLRRADVVLISCPYTDQTRNLIDRSKLALMKPSAVLVNVARGGIVDEGALAEALRAGRLAGAGLDVCETEPLPPDSPLWEVPNLVITPHYAGLSTKRATRLKELFCDNLRRYLSGQPLRNVVDKQAGYPTQR